ncbi:hypothetical protein H5J22_02385 [Cetobacterium sp. 8H]|uniref:hypothetical protein n=1 Tax=Cetobacterium sp. 8H TaxID=2759681 RepID=UPI00163B946D|nr:hypothetical protein [Cetobacterium sp. 8H]MBC2850290.1 hypothetical protein [Cetobacterium sp. 8H]
MFDEKEEALKIYSKLENLIKTKGIKAQDISNYLKINKQSVSNNRQLLKSGKLPNGRFLVGISKFFNENFL